MHHLNVAEFVPALPAVGGAAELALSLFTVVLWGVALGLAIAWRYTIGAALEWAANLMDRVSFTVLHVHVAPLAPFSAELRAIDVAITKGLNKVLTGAEYATVWLFHHGLNLIVWSARETWALARDTYKALQHFDRVTLPRAIHDALRATGAFATYIAHEIAKGNERLWHDTQSLWHRENTQRRAHDRVVDGKLSHALPRVRELEKEAAQLRARVKALELALGAVAFPELMLRGFDRLGLRWFRCPSFQNLGKKLGCFSFAFLESLLFLAWETFAVIDLCRFADGMTRLAEEMRPLMFKFVDVEEALVGCHGSTKPPNLSVPHIAPPPTNAGLALAA